MRDDSGTRKEGKEGCKKGKSRAEETKERSKGRIEVRNEGVKTG